MASTGEVWKLGRRPALDGLRGIAVALVVVSHTELRFIAAGPVGVTVFFVLSGFLITALLLDERERAGRVDLRAFYLRRARRLLPALGAFLAVMLAVGAATLGQVAPVVLYVANFAETGRGLPHALEHTWSLSVEEQFYLVFPLALVALRHASRLALGAVLTLGITASLALRLLLWEPGTGRVYFGTDTNAYALLAGCLLAVVMIGRPARQARPAVAATCVALLVSLSFAPEGVQARVFAPIGAAALAAAAIYCLVGDGRTRFEHPALTWLGRRSYAVYLWHLPLLALPFGGAWVLAEVAAALLIAEVSWRYVEQPFLRQRPIPLMKDQSSRLRVRWDGLVAVEK